MKESMKNGRRLIHLVTEKELRTYMHPLRQKIRRLLELRPEGLTAKQVADSLSIAPSSAGTTSRRSRGSGLSNWTAPSRSTASPRNFTRPRRST